MRFSDRILRFFRHYLPAPFTLAVLLTLLSLLLALVFTSPAPDRKDPYFFQLLGFWQDGFWGLLKFAMQMMLMLVLGHVLALSKPFNALISRSLFFCRDTATAALTVTLLTCFMALFNWGLGLIFGAVFARKVGEYAADRLIPLNYSVIGAAGYSGLMVWHGGLSGSAPIKVAEAGHELEAITGQIGMEYTVFSTMNLVVALALLIVLPLAMYWLGKRAAPSPEGVLARLRGGGKPASAGAVTGGAQRFPAERLDDAPWMAYLFGGMLMLTAVYQAFFRPDELSLGFLNPNWINFFLFGAGLLLHGSFRSFLDAVGKAIGGSAGIMIQFPLYAGILGILSHSGLIGLFSDFFVDISTETTFPLYTFFSGGVVNFFVPSGGGQWIVQGSVVMDAACELGFSQPKAVMALAYGDQLTNMLQPFWALPLLGITELRARDILPYTMFLMLVGAVIFIGALLIF